MRDGAEGLSGNELETKLAGFVRSYIQASHGSDSSQQEALRCFCSGLEYLLGGLLEGHGAWRGWVDGILPETDMFPDSVNLISTVELSVRGRAIWAKNSRGPFWIEPFPGVVRISETSDAIISYDLKFADATRGLARFPYGKHIRKADWFFPARWLFAFSKGITTKNAAPGISVVFSRDPLRYWPLLLRVAVLQLQGNTQGGV
jgi:hypothetical protein